MYIIVVGAGKVGYYLTKELMSQGHEVLVIDEDLRPVERIKEELSAMALRGNGCLPAFLEQAGIKRADTLIAVTGDDEDNLVACQIAKGYFNVPRTIARINNPKNESVFRKLGIDLTVSSTELILAQIEEQLPTHALRNLLTLRSMGVGIYETTVPPDSPVIGIPLKDLNIPDDCIFPLVVRNGQPIVPHGKTKLEANDQVLAVTTPGNRDLLAQMLIGDKKSP